MNINLVPKTLELFKPFVDVSGFSLTRYLESFTPIFGLGTPVFQRISSKLHCGTHTFSHKCLWDSNFQNPSENPVCNIVTISIGTQYQFQ